MAEDTPPVAWVTAGLEAVIAHHKGQRDAYWNCPSSGEVRAVIAAVVPLAAARAVRDAGFDQARLAAQVIRLQVRLDAAVHDVCGRIARKCEEEGNALPPGVERTAWLSAAAVALAARDGQERSDEKEARDA